MKTFIYITLTILSGLYANITNAQPGTNLINSEVISFEESLPIKGATVAIKGANKLTVTGPDGSFKISASPDDKTLVIKHPEYETAEVNITGKNTLQIVLKVANSGAINLPGSLWLLSFKHPATDFNCR